MVGAISGRETLREGARADRVAISGVQIAIQSDGFLTFATSGQISTDRQIWEVTPENTLHRRPAPAVPIERLSIAGGRDLFISGVEQIWLLAGDGSFRVIAGVATAAFAGDGGPATEAKFSSPAALSIGADGRLYVADYSNGRIRVIDSDGIVGTVVDPVSALILPTGVVADKQGNLFILDRSGPGADTAPQRERGFDNCSRAL